MASIFDLAVMSVSSAPGTGSTIGLGSAAVIGGVTYLTFAQSGVTNGVIVDYSILDPTNGGSEIGTATYSTTGPQLTGRTVTVSTNSNTAINASAASIVRISPRAETLNDAGLFLTGTLGSPRGGTGVSSPAAHTIPINEGASAQANTGTGTAGQALISNGASADPSYKSGMPVLLETLSPSASSTISTSASWVGYSRIEIIISDLQSSIGSAGLQAQATVGTLQTTGYVSNFSTASGTSVGTNTSTTFLLLSSLQIGASVAPGLNGEFSINDPNSTSNKKLFRGYCAYSVSAGTIQNGITYCTFNTNTSAWSGLTFSLSTGTMTGTIRIYARV